MSAAIFLMHSTDTPTVPWSEVHDIYWSDRFECLFVFYLWRILSLAFLVHQSKFPLVLHFEDNVYWTDNFNLFMPRAWKVRRGHLVIGSSVCPFVRPTVRYSVPLTIKMQYPKFGWWCSNQTWAGSSSMGPSHFTDIPCPWRWVGVKM